MKSNSKRFRVLIIGLCVGVIALLGGVIAAHSTEQDKPTVAAQTLQKHAVKEAVLEFVSHKVLGRVPLKDYHHKIHQNGENCELCHGVKNPTAPANTKYCANCHGTPKDVSDLWEKLHKDDKDHTINPHNSPHWGTDMPCDMCHREHEKSQFYCKTCHHFEYKVP